MQMFAQDVAMGIEEEYGLSGDGGGGKALSREAVSHLAKLLAQEHPNTFDNPIGGRLYLDGNGDSVNQHQHYEGCTPECAGEDACFNLSLYTRALDSLVLELFRSVVARETGNSLPLARYHLLKDSTDWRGNRYGRQINLRVPRTIQVTDFVQYLAPYLCTSIIWSGQGGIKPDYSWLEQENAPVRFVLSPRIFGIKTLYGSDTTNNRALICTARFQGSHTHDKDEWARLQIPRDPLVLDYATYVDAGITSLIIRLLANGGIPGSFPHFPNGMDSRPIDDACAISFDPALSAQIHLEGGNFTALELQKKYLQLLQDSEKILALTDRDQDVLAQFEGILNDLEEDPLLLADRCEVWLLYKICLAKLEREGATWSTCGQVNVSYRNRETRLSYFLMSLARQMTALDEWGILPKKMRAEEVFLLHSPEVVKETKKVPPKTSRAPWRKRVFERARELGIVAEAGTVNGLDDSWSEIRFNVSPAILPHPQNAVFNKDPTGRENQEKLKEAEEIMQEILRRSTGPIC